ncbi:MAG: type II toxin-antitoxin system HicB family antitoxin [Phycisphaerae bacterium]|nr:type II toxin-antitoxin system HicB family antitoxin [Phycisphaerae bacterium]
MKLAVRVVISERGGYMATCPSLPGCTTWGNTHEEARKKLDEAIRGYIAAVSNRVLEDIASEVVEV